MEKYFKVPFMEEENDLGGGNDGLQEEQEKSEINEEPEVKEEPKEETVPLKKYLEEKKRRKELEKKQRELEEKSIDSDVLIRKNQIKSEWIDKGFDESVAELMAKQAADILAEVKKSTKKNPDTLYDEEIQDLSESDSMFEDAPLYKEQIKELMKSGKTAEEAYIKLRGKTRLREIMLNKEQIAAAKRTEVESKKTVTPTAGKSNDPYPLDDKDKKALKKLQDTFPNGGWTAEKYYKKMYKE